MDLYSDLRYFLENKDIKGITSTIDMLVNNYNFSKKVFATEIQKDEIAEKVFAEIAELWLVYLAFSHKRKYLYDARNELSCKKGWILCKSLNLNWFNDKNISSYAYWEDKNVQEELLKEYDSFTIKVVSELAQMHRTLQQTFSGAVLYYLGEFSKKYSNNIKLLITNHELPDYFYDLPLI